MINKWCFLRGVKWLINGVFVMGWICLVNGVFVIGVR